MTDQTPSRVRYAITFLSVLAGIGYAAIDAYWGSRHLPRPTPAGAATLSPAESRLLFDACVTFYGTVYLCGRRLYTFLGRHAQSAELRQWSVWHMRVLNAVGGVWLLASGWRSLVTFGVVRPSSLLAVALLVQAAFDMRSTGNAPGRGSPADT